MKPAEAIILAGEWPRNKTVPKQLRLAYDAAKGNDKWEIGTLSEALMAAAETKQDLALVVKYWQ